MDSTDDMTHCVVIHFRFTIIRRLATVAYFVTQIVRRLTERCTTPGWPGWETGETWKKVEKQESE
jgi:hypothetical protein